MNPNETNTPLKRAFGNCDGCTRTKCAVWFLNGRLLCRTCRDGYKGPALNPKVIEAPAEVTIATIERITTEELAEWRAVVEAKGLSTAPWRSMRDGNQYLNGKYGQEYSTEFSNNNLVGASIVDGLPRAWNPFYVQDATELENVSRFKDEDADFIELARTALIRLIDEVERQAEQSKRLIHDRELLIESAESDGQDIESLRNEVEAGRLKIECLTQERDFWQIRRFSDFCRSCGSQWKGANHHCAGCGSPMTWNLKEGRLSYKDRVTETESLRTQLRAWTEVFGTSQLTHAKDAAESKAERLERELRKAQGEIDRLRGINPDSDRAAEICAEMERRIRAATASNPPKE